MNRREALKRVAWLMGGTVSASAILAVRNSYSATSPAGNKPSFLSSPQAAIVSTVAEIMIPRTDTPGAIDVGVPGFIDRALADVYAAEDQKRYLAGLTAFEAAAQTEHGKKFVALEAPQQVALVQKFHDAAVLEERRAEDSDESQGPRKSQDSHDKWQRPFILMTKELTLLGFFTSKAGATQILQYQAVPGSYHACISLAQAGNGKTWAFMPGLDF
ncbi:MAG: gluconate 2-dehydrogenase subunit 3 family protein [Sinobacteraceae bacterium]|nr:gluconate 2-dehydrogenase subunit 3 family protein [Nevskiaceae bacterium]